jgi:hypothetical protein
MAVVAHIVLPGVSKDQYDRVRAAVGWLDEPPIGGISHVTWWTGNDCHIVDAWDSEGDFNTFGETRLGPGMTKAGVEAQPQVTFDPAHEVFTPKSVKITS